MNRLRSECGNSSLHSVLGRSRLRFEVLTAASMKMDVFWVVAPCNLSEVYRHFRGDCCLHHQGDEQPSSRSRFFSPMVTLSAYKHAHIQSLFFPVMLLHLDR
jgi:hypothetical protein